MKPKQISKFVLDCSIALAWVLPGEQDDANQEILLMLKQARALVPIIWSLELANGLLQAERRKKISELEAAEFKDFFAALPIGIDDFAATRVMNSIYLLAKSQQLTIYDAAYLELAVRESLPLATLDKALQKAAKQMEIVIL